MRVGGGARRNVMERGVMGRPLKPKPAKQTGQKLGVQMAMHSQGMSRGARMGMGCEWAG